MEAYLRDKEFLTELCSQRERDVFARVTALDLKGKPIEQIESKVTGGSINIDGSSAVRRTCSLTMVTESLDINEYYWGFKTQIKIEIGLKNNLDKYKDKEIIWFNMGIYLISSFSLSQSTTGITININGKDKMCQLNGEMGGVLMAQTDFGQVESYDEFGNRTLKKIPIQQIITDMIHQYADEDFSKIIIEDIEDYGLNLQTYRGSDPCYLFLLGTEDGARAPEQIETNGRRTVWVPCIYDKDLTVQRLYDIADKKIQIDDIEKKDILNITPNYGDITDVQARAVELYYQGKSSDIIEEELIDEYTKQAKEDPETEKPNEIINFENYIEKKLSESVKNVNVEAIQKYHDNFFYGYCAAKRLKKIAVKSITISDNSTEQSLINDIKLDKNKSFSLTTCAEAILNYIVEKDFDYEGNNINQEQLENYISWVSENSPENVVDEEYDYLWVLPGANELELKWWEFAARRIEKISAKIEDVSSPEEEEWIKSFIGNSHTIYARHGWVYRKYIEIKNSYQNQDQDVSSTEIASEIEADPAGKEIIMKYNIDVSAIRQYEIQHGILSIDASAQTRSEIALDNLDGQKFNFFFNPGNKLTNEEVTIPVFLKENSNIQYFIRKIEYGNTIGYTITDLVYNSDLIANAGETLTSVLDKIKTMLGDFEYFYDVDGNFIFRQQRSYRESYSGDDLLRLEIGMTFERENEETGEKETISNDNSIFLIQSFDSGVDFEFKDLELVTQISNNPAIGNVKNDYSVWGNKKGSGDKTIPIHMRYAIDTKPEEYHTIGLTPSRACILLRTYPDIYTLQAGETEELAVRRLMSAHRTRHFYTKVPARMKLLADRLVESYLIPFVNKLATYEIEYPIDDSVLEGAKELIKTLQSITVKKIDFENDQNYKLLKNFFEFGIEILLKKQHNVKDFLKSFGDAVRVFNSFNKFLESFNEVVDNLYDWRELIYQMAKDYRFFNQTDEFRVWLEEANPMTCIDGKTGYEQYYIDMESFWRDIYDKEYHQVKWDDPLQEGQLYIIDDGEKEEDGTPILYNTEKIYYKTDDGKRILIPDFDIYTLSTGAETDDKYKKIGTLYEIVKNNYKILEPVIERYIINEWISTHPEMIYRLKGLHPNDEEDYINSHFLYMRDPQTWAKKRNEIKPHYADNLFDQLHGYQKPYYHKGDIIAENDALDGVATYLSASKVPIDDSSTNEQIAKMNILINKKPDNILLDENGKLTMDSVKKAFNIIFEVVETNIDQKTEISKILLEYADILYDFSNNNGTNEDQIRYSVGLIALAQAVNKIYGITTIDGYKSFVKKYFMNIVCEYIYRCNAFEFNGIYDSTGDNINIPDIPDIINAAYSNIFNLAIKQLCLDETNSNIFNKEDFTEYGLKEFYQQVSGIGVVVSNNKSITKDDFMETVKIFLKSDNDLTKEIVQTNVKNFFKKYIYHALNKTSGDEVKNYLQELYYRITFDPYALTFRPFENTEFLRWIAEALYDEDIIKKVCYKILSEKKQGEVEAYNTIINILNRTVFKRAIWERGRFLFQPYSNSLYFENISITDEKTRNKIADYVMPKILTIFDIDQDKVFSLLDVQKMVDYATQNPTLTGLNQSVISSIAFDKQEKATFDKAQFLFYCYFAWYAYEKNNEINANSTWKTTGSNNIKNLKVSVQTELKNTPDNDYLINIWILSLTSLAIEHCLKMTGQRNPYYVKAKILAWTKTNWDNGILYNAVKSRFNNDSTYKILSTEKKVAEDTKELPLSVFEKYLIKQLKLKDIVALGDVDGDGRISKDDVALAQKYVKEGPTLKEAEANLKKAKEEW